MPKFDQTTQAKVDALYSIYSSEYAMDNFSVEQMDALEYAMAVMDLDDEYKGIMNRATKLERHAKSLFSIGLALLITSGLFAVFVN